MTELDAVIVGAGQAGLGVSYFLQRDGRKHVVLEQGRIGETWRSQRWDSFRLNSPNFMNVLPGLDYAGPEPDGFWSRDEFVDYLQGYVGHWQLPIRTGITVVSVEQAQRGQTFIVRTRSNGQSEEFVTSRSVVIAAGILRTPKLPAAQSRIPQGITQLHTADYRNPEALPPGAVYVAGSGQSGCQIAEEILATGRTVYLSTSRVGRTPRRYRGRDIFAWWIDSRFFDVTYASLQDKTISREPQPQVSGHGRYGHTVSLQQLARRGAVILGRFLDIEDGALIFDDDAAANVRYGDEFSQRQKDDIDTYLAKNDITPPPVVDDPADLPDTEAACASPLRRLNLSETKISTVIWATGFGGDFSWLQLPVLDAAGKPVHQQGISPVPGLYFIGLPWLRSRKSGLIYGIKEDARFLAGAIAKQLG